MTSSRTPSVRLLLGAALAVLTVGTACDPPVSLQSPRPSQLVDDPSVAVSGRVSHAFDETTVELLVDGVDLLAELGVVPPFVNVAGVVQIGGVPVQVSELTWTEKVPSLSFDTVSFRLTGLAPDSHVIELSVLDTTNAERVATRSFSTSEPLALLLESWDAGGLAPNTLPLSFGKAASASLGAGLAGGVVPLASGETIREGLPAAAAAF
jgi:hypothetical protein